MSEYTQQIAELAARAKSLLAECDAVVTEYDGKEMPKEVDNSLQGNLGEIDRIKTRLETLRQMDGNRAAFEELDELKGANAGWRPSAPGEGNEDVDEKSWREVEVPTMYVHPLYGFMPGVKNVRYYVPLRVQKAGKDYDPAFESYLRKGFGRIGPNDQKTLTEGVDSAGGVLTPADVQGTLIKKMATIATVRMHARVIQTSRDIAQWPKLNYTTDDKYTSGVRVTWTGESPASSTSHRVTDPAFGIYNIPINTMMASMPVSRNLIEDAAFDVIGIATDLLAEAFALGENDKFWNGTGAGVPKGITASMAATSGSPAADEIDWISSLGAANITDPKDITSLIYALPAQYERNAKLFFRKATEKVIRELTDTGGMPIWPIVNMVGQLGVAPREILGFPTVRDEFVPAIAGDAYPAVFGDLSGYLVADRVGLTIERLNEVYAETNIHVLLGRKRVGGQVVEPWRIKGLKTVSST
jgi:HK97 family phage major capsid protein